MFWLKPKFPHTPQKQAPRTVLEQQLSDRARFNPDWHHAFYQRPTVGPQTNTGNYAYTTLGLAEFSPIGTGIVARSPMQAFSNGKPLVYFAAYRTQGLGGLVQGQIFGQPLYDPNAQGV